MSGKKICRRRWRKSILRNKRNKAKLPLLRKLFRREKTGSSRSCGRMENGMMMVIQAAVLSWKKHMIPPRKKKYSTRKFEMIYRDEVSSKAVTIYRYLHDRQGKHENCFPSHRTIALDNKCSVSTVKRAIDELVKKGYVVKENRRRKNGGKTSNVYICK